uniref:histone acetyltransferase HAC12-like n=1 Tax=Erigeron canadensis TaxID=72917 RepID=UPI001CB8CEFC|nr:histone acetyltransferase HAC12-like [Erigeron canadensis]
MSVLDQQVHQLSMGSNDRFNDTLNGFTIPQVNIGEPLPSQPLVTEDTTYHNCYDLSCNLCGPANYCMTTKNRKYDFMEPVSNESLIGSSPPVEVLLSSVNTSDRDQFSQDFSAFQLPPLVDSGDVSVVNTESLTMNSGPEVSQVVTEDIIGNNQIFKGSDGNVDTTSTNYELKEPPASRLEEKNNDQKPETSQLGPKVICVNNSAAEITPSVMESNNKQTEITSFDNGSESGSLNIKKPSTSLAEYFNASQIKEYLSTFIKHDKEILGSSVNQNPCQLCSMHKLLIAPVPIYCSSCDSRIKQNARYYQSSDVENTGIHHYFCMKCYKGNRKAINLMRGGSISKTNLQKAKNDEEGEDSWVQCDRCQQWQHRICGLYNDARDEEGKAEYICPKCLLKQMEDGNEVPLAKTFLRAKDLPKTNLSDHIEQRLFTRMTQERIETARFHGTALENVPEAEDLVVRVVVSVDRELEVKKQFRDIFNGEYYPEKFSYRSKLILLFQKAGGVELCLFGMYVQEFGSECASPNKRCVYILYLDSVKYFQPERKTASGEPLRTFVYHEILIGYLEHCKKRGFASCYIWACPPNGDDYIFYCHPKTQKTPKENQLRQWYKLMLRKAAKDGIVVEQTNLYNQFFVPTNEENSKITATHLPYFDGSYWSGIAEIISKKLEEEENSGGSYSKLPSKRIWLSMGQDRPTKDAIVMQHLGEEILPMKENLMIVRLQHMCTYCHEVILSGSRWSCNRCNKIQLCSRCFENGKLLSTSRVHSCHSGSKRPLSESASCDLPLHTKDNDVKLVNNFSGTRDDFLNNCQKSQYQFDTLGHAKYSSMMILYHFTNSLVVLPICSLCCNQVLINECWHCDTCTTHYVCGSCYETKGDTCHTHKLTHPSQKVYPETKSEQPENQKVLTLNEALDALSHASQCRSIKCSYHGCLIIRKLLYHTKKCRNASDCRICKRAWLVLKKHAQICRDSNCRVPRCMDIEKKWNACIQLRINKLQSSGNSGDWRTV